MSYYITTYNGHALYPYGLVTPGQAGVQDGPTIEMSKRWLPGGARPHVNILRRTRRPLVFSAVLAADDHETFLSNLDAVKGILFPDDDVYHPLIVADRAGQQIMAKPTSLPVESRSLPGYTCAEELKIPMEVYPYWEDVTAQSVNIGLAFLTYRQATFEHTELDGWEAMGGAVVSVDTTAPYSGAACMKVVASAGSKGAATPAAGISGITAGNVYSLQAKLRASTSSVTVSAIVWYTAAGDYISEVSASHSVTDEWGLFKLENCVAPATAAKAAVCVYRLGAMGGPTFYVDNVCLEEAAACGDFITPADANTKVVNDGQLRCYPTYTCTVGAAMATGLAFTVGGITFTYEGALDPADILVVDSDQDCPDVELNGTRDWANVDDAVSVLPFLAVGQNAVTLSDSSKFSLTVEFQRRYW